MPSSSEQKITRSFTRPTTPTGDAPQRRAGVCCCQSNNLDRLPGDIQPVVAAPDEVDLPAKYSVLTVGPSFKQRVRGPFFVAAEAGVTLWRRFEFDGDQIDDTPDQDRSLFLRFGIAYRPNFKIY